MRPRSGRQPRLRPRRRLPKQPLLLRKPWRRLRLRRRRPRFQRPTRKRRLPRSPRHLLRLKRAGRPQLLQSLHSLGTGALRLQVQNRFVGQFLSKLHFLSDISGDLFVTLLFQGKLGSHELHDLLYVHLHLGLQCHC